MNRETLVGTYTREYPEWMQQRGYQYCDESKVAELEHALANYNAHSQASYNSSLQNSYKSPARLSLEAAQKKAAEIRSRRPEMQVRRIRP